MIAKYWKLQEKSKINIISTLDKWDFDPTLYIGKNLRLTMTLVISATEVQNDDSRANTGHKDL